MKKLLILTLFIFCSWGAMAQRVSLSTDLLRLGTLTPNLSVETTLSSRLTLNLEGAINPFGEVYNNFDPAHASLSTELRWWFQRTMYAHFVGVNFVGGIYDVNYKDYSNKGQTFAAGLTYGYSLILTRRWVLTPTIGYGCGLFDQATSGERQWKPTLTKFGVGITYIID